MDRDASFTLHSQRLLCWCSSCCLAFSTWSFTMKLMHRCGVQIMGTLKRHPLCWLKWWEEGKVDKGWNVIQMKGGCFRFIHSFSNNVPIHYSQITVLDNQWLAGILKLSEPNTKTLDNESAQMKVWNDRKCHEWFD